MNAEQEKLQREIERLQKEKALLARQILEAADIEEVDRLTKESLLLEDRILYLKNEIVFEAYYNAVKLRNEAIIKGDKLSKPAVDFVKPKPFFRRIVPFDIVVYVDHHGECKLPSDPSFRKNVPSGINLSLMRSGSYGTFSIGSLDVSTIIYVIKEIMKKNKSKDAVFQGLQHLFQLNKANQDEFTKKQFKNDPRRQREDLYEHLAEAGFEYKLKVKQYYNTEYSSDAFTHNSATVVYSFPGSNLVVGEVIKMKTLETMIDFIIKQGYTNIGIIEFTCHSVPGLTNRSMKKARIELDKQGISGGNRTKRRKGRTPKRST